MVSVRIYGAINSRFESLQVDHSHIRANFLLEVFYDLGFIRVVILHEFNCSVGIGDESEETLGLWRRFRLRLLMVLRFGLILALLLELL